MWQFGGTLAIAAFGGSFLIYYLTNFLLQEKAKFAFDWDGVIERAAVAYLVMTPKFLFLIPLVILIKIAVRLIALGFFPSLLKSGEPGVVAQKVTLKAELALSLFISPVFAALVGIIF
jgi:hypothetical protein